MNSDIILNAMTDIDNAYILSAQKQLGYAAQQQAVPFPKRHRSVRKYIALIAAVIAMTAVLFTAVLAASPELREKVFIFLGITKTEVIPEFGGTAPGNMAVEDDRILIGGVVKATYVHFPVQSYARNGIFLLCTDETMMNSGNRYNAYWEKDGELVQLEEHKFKQDYHVLGNEVHIEFDWVVHENNVCFTYVDESAAFRKQNLAGDVTATLFTVDIELPGGLGWTAYPVLINVETGELTDICAGTGVEKLPNLYQAAISADLSKMLLVDWDNNLYYVDLSAKVLYSVDELVGRHVEECSLTGNTLACWVLDGDCIETGTLGTYRGWAVDLETMKSKELFSGMPSTAATSYDVWSNAYDTSPEIWNKISGGLALAPLTHEGLQFIQGFSLSSNWGNMYSGSKFAVEVDLERQVHVVDLATGEKPQIQGFSWPELEYPDIQCVPSPDGEKLLIYTCTTEGYFGSIGVLDFSQNRYFEFSRENLNTVNEHTIYWFDNDSIVVATDWNGDSMDYYVYRLI